MQDQAFKVFVSSTTVDFGTIRSSVIEAIGRLQLVPIAMPQFGASSKPPEEVATERVWECDVFVGLIGYWYGTVPNGYIQSVTEMEYETAVLSKKTILMYVPSSSYTGHKTLNQQAPDERSLRFIDRIQREGYTCGTYSDPGDLPHIVAIDLVRLQTGGAYSLQGVRAFRNGILHLENNNYTSAMNDLTWAVQLLPREGAPAFLLSLALLHGLRPKLHTLDEIRQVEQWLGVAERLTPGRAVYAFHSAVVRDYLVRNGFENEYRAYELQQKSLAHEPDPYNLKLIFQFQPDLANEYLRGYA